MNEYFAIITQNGYDLTATDVNLPHQYSGNIPIKIVKDIEKFSDYELIPFFVHSNFNYVDVVASNEAFPMEYNAETGIAILPYEAFKKRGYLFISLTLKENDGDKVIYTGTVMLDIRNSLNGENTIPTETVWVDAIVQFVNNYMNTNYEPKYNELFQNSQELQKDAENLHQTATSQQKSINQTLQETQELQESASQLVSNAEDLQETVGQQQTQIDDLVDDVTTKLENGDFNGKTILYGEGIPSKTLGDVGDAYINTLTEGLYPYYLFTKDEEDWVPRWSMRGVDGTDTLPILGTMFFPSDEETPTGYEDVEDYYIPSDIVRINGEKTLSETIDELVTNGTTQEQINNAVSNYVDQAIEDGSLANMTIEDDSITPEKTEFMDILKNSPVVTTLSGAGYNQQQTDYIDVDGIDTLYALVEGASTNKCGFNIQYFNSEKTSLSTEAFKGKEESRLIYYSLTDDRSIYMTQKFIIELTKPENTKYVRIIFTNFLDGTHTVQLFYNDSYNEYDEDDNYLIVRDKYNQDKLINDHSIDLLKTNFLTYKNPNLININKVGDTGYSTANDGSPFYQFGGIANNNFFLDYIDTSVHKDVYFRFANNTYANVKNFGRIACYDADKTWLYCDMTGDYVTYTMVRSAMGSTSDHSYITMDDGEQVNAVWVVKLTVPEEVKYIRIGALNSVANVLNLYKYIIVSYDDILNLTAIADRYEKVINEDFKKLVNDCLEDTTEAKTMVMIGDSLTNWGGGSDNGDGFLKIVHDKTGIITKNEGLAGATWQTADGQTQCGVTRVNTLINEEREYDLYCFLLGTNGGSPTDTGETSSDTSTMVGAIRYCLETLKAYDPTAQILVCLPPQRAEGNENQESVNNVIKTIAEYYSVETLDLYHGSGIVPNTKIANINYLSDGLHLNTNGQTVLGNILSAKIKYLLCI